VALTLLDFFSLAAPDYMLGESLLEPAALKSTLIVSSLIA